MKVEFIDEEITVEFAKKPGPPTSILWRGQQIGIVEIYSSRPDYSFGPMKHHARWWQRRHRIYYRGRTTDGDMIEFYLDRSLNKWVLYRRWHPKAENAAGDS